MANYVALRPHDSLTLLIVHPLDRLGIKKLKANLAQSNLLTKLSHGVMRVNFKFGGDS